MEVLPATDVRDLSSQATGGLDTLSKAVAPTKQANANKMLVCVKMLCNVDSNMHKLFGATNAGDPEKTILHPDTCESDLNNCLQDVDRLTLSKPVAQKVNTQFAFSAPLKPL